MKKVFDFSKIFFAFFIIYSFYSFSNSASSHGNSEAETENLQSKVIWIVGYTTLDSTLTLNSREDGRGNDERLAHARKNQVIQWKIKGSIHSEIEILDVQPDPNYQNDPNFFLTGPQPHGSFWEAQIGDAAMGGIVTEKYYIKWKLRNSAGAYVYDPFIQLNPNIQ
ncbi:hypothetical protein BH20BAC1_BH20BAC1_05460 [soil metagenome]